jgi:hypothetical protein
MKRRVREMKKKTTSVAPCVVSVLFVLVAFITWFGCCLDSRSKIEKYETEIQLVRQFGFHLSKGNAAAVRRMSVADAYFLESPSYLKEATGILSKIDLDSLSVDRVKRGEEDKDLLFVSVYFEGAEDKSMNLILKREREQWLVKSISFSHFLSSD